MFIEFILCAKSLVGTVNAIMNNTDMFLDPHRVHSPAGKTGNKQKRKKYD